MKYFKSDAGEIFAYEEDGSQDEFIKEGLIPITEEQLAEIRAAQAADNAPTIEQLTSEALSVRDSLLSVASLRVAPLQDAVDLGEATSEESSSLLLWKKYRVDVNRITSQPTFPRVIDWPVAPS